MGPLYAVKNDKLLELEIPLPPLPEQRRIAAALTEHLASVEQAQTALETRLEAAQAMLAALLREAFESEEAQGWERRRLGEVCDIQLGKMLSPLSKIGDEPLPYLRNANVQWGRFDLDDISEMDFSEREQKKFELRSGDVLVCEGGEPGRAAVWEEQITPCYYQKALHRLRVNPLLTTPHFVMYRIWHGAEQREFIESNAKTTIAHLPEIRLRELEIPLPSVGEQEQIVQQIEQNRSSLFPAIKSIQCQLTALNAMPAALLRKAFNGEL